MIPFFFSCAHQVGRAPHSPLREQDETVQEPAGGDLIPPAIESEEPCRTKAAPSLSGGGIILSFDDYSESWVELAQLLQKYNAHATFYISLDPRETGEGELKLLKFLREMGHELAWHTASHPDLKKIPLSGREEALNREILAPLEFFHKHFSRKIRSFAYPFGFYDKDWEQRLSRIFASRRGFGRTPEYYSSTEIQTGHFFKGVSIDNTIYTDRIDRNKEAGPGAFAAFCLSVFSEIQSSSRYIILGSHSLGGDPWGITPENLEYLLSGAEKRGIPVLSLEETCSL